MTLQASGPISLSQVNTELARSSTAAIDMNSSIVRTLFQKPSGAISMSDGYGKANKFAIAINSNMTDLDLRPWLVSQGWDQSVAVEVTNNASIYASSTGTYGLYVTGSFPGGLTIINNGNIVGRGGRGDGSRAFVGAGVCTAVQYVTLATAGGPAMYVSTYCTVYNNSIIGGGGGGGGSGGARYLFTPPQSCAYPPTMAYSCGGPGGGGAGNGAGGGFNVWQYGQTAGSATGNCTGAGQKTASYDAPTAGMTTAGPAGSVAPSVTSDCNSSVLTGAEGGAGGSLGASGNNGTLGTTGAYSDTDSRYAGYGRAGGAAIDGNAYITWGAYGSRYGAIN